MSDPRRVLRHVNVTLQSNRQPRATKQSMKKAKDSQCPESPLRCPMYPTMNVSHSRYTCIHLISARNTPYATYSDTQTPRHPYTRTLRHPYTQTPIHSDIQKPILLHPTPDTHTHAIGYIRTHE
ncbi:hypothetical protein K438DRAFT_1264274 [Mycena galopus ATCC 62051]|nr:hypothetical protein K438DRAFT_1264274 [Mycena galopus ATCC 62051]